MFFAFNFEALAFGNVFVAEWNLKARGGLAVDRVAVQSKGVFVDPAFVEEQAHHRESESRPFGLIRMLRVKINQGRERLRAVELFANALLFLGKQWEVVFDFNI